MRYCQVVAFAQNNWWLFRCAAISTLEGNLTVGMKQAAQLILYLGLYLIEATRFFKLRVCREDTKIQNRLELTTRSKREKKPQNLHP